MSGIRKAEPAIRESLCQAGMGLRPKPINHSPNGMIGQTVSHYKILEKLGEVPNFPTSVLQRVVGSLSIPPLFGGSQDGNL